MQKGVVGRWVGILLFNMRWKEFSETCGEYPSLPCGRGKVYDTGTAAAQYGQISSRPDVLLASGIANPRGGESRESDTE